MKLRQLIRDYFTFSRNERKGIVVLLVLILLLAAANKVIFYFEKPAKIDSGILDSSKQELAAYNDSLNLDLQQQSIKSADSGFEEGRYSDNSEKSQDKEPNTDRDESLSLFKFDPNKCSDEDFHQLGFSDKQTEAIRKYISKGAVFKRKDDFFKIRVITEKQKARLSSWIEISEPTADFTSRKENISSIMIEINSADSLTLAQLPGIGKVLSKRIVKYRDLLGGFYSIDQIKEVYGINEQTFGLIEDKVTVDPSRIKKIDLNFSDARELSRHPYLQRNLAAKIVKFRSKNGSLKNLAVLRDSMILNIEEYNRIKPYF